MKFIIKSECKKVLTPKTIARMENQRKLNSYRPSNGTMTKSKIRFGYRDCSFL
jgi:hypothetical protein